MFPQRSLRDATGLDDLDVVTDSEGRLGAPFAFARLEEQMTFPNFGDRSNLVALPKAEKALNTGQFAHHLPSTSLTAPTNIIGGSEATWPSTIAWAQVEPDIVFEAIQAS